MDTMAFSQERLKRQFDDLKGDTKGIPTEIFDMKKKARLHTYGNSGDKTTTFI